MIKEEVGGLLAWATNYQSADVNDHGLWRFSTHQCLGLHIIPAVGNRICGVEWKSGFVFATEVKTDSQRRLMVPKPMLHKSNNQNAALVHHVHTGNGVLGTW